MHRSSFAAVLVSVALLGCRSETSLEAAPPDVAIRILSPEYGSFHGEGPVTVRGHVSTPAATVTVEDQVVPVGPDGIFEVDLPITHDYLNIDAKAELLGVKARDRLPVFRGREPSETWPGGVTLRVTPPLLTIIGEALGAQFDETGWSESLGDLLPPLAFQGIELTPVGVSHDPTVVELIPVEGGVDVALSLRHLTMDYVTTIDLFGIPLEVPVAFGYEEVAVGVMATPAVDADGMVTLELGEADVVLGEPIVEVFLLDAAFLEPTLVQLAGFVEPIVELVLGLAVGAVGEIPLGGPFAFETDLMGTPLEARLSDIYGEVPGIGAGMAVGLGEPAQTGPLSIPAPIEDALDVHLAVGLHEGLLDRLVSDAGLLSQLEQDIVLPGVLGDFVGNAVRALPGGDQAPWDGDGWCLTIAPQPADVVRLKEGIDPLAVVNLPDVHVSVAPAYGQSCGTWLKASLALEVGLVVRDGTEVGIDLVVAEGVVLDYAATGEHDEAAIVAGLGTLLESAIGLFAGQLSFDLADALGAGAIPLPGLEDASPQILDSSVMTDADGVPIEGLYSIAIGLFPPESPS